LLFIFFSGLHTSAAAYMVQLPNARNVPA